MKMFGVHCLLCQGDLEILQIVNGGLHTKCTNCGHIGRPEIRQINNTVYSNFTRNPKNPRKAVDVQYSRSNRPSSPPQSTKTPSGTWNKDSFLPASYKKIG